MKHLIQVGPRASASAVHVHIADVTELVCDLPLPVDINGAIKAKLVLHYKAPLVLGTGDSKFTGVFAHVQTPDKTVHVPDSLTFVGTAGSPFRLEVIVDYPDAAQDYYVYLTSKSNKYENDLILHDLPTPTPNVKVAMTVNPLVGLAPDVQAFRAGTFTQTTGVWTAVMRWDILRIKLLCDWACILPTDTTGFGGVSLFIKTGSGKYVKASDLITKDAFSLSGTDMAYYGGIAIEGVDIPAIPEPWDFIAVSSDMDGKPNHDLSGNPFGSVITLMTLSRATQPITDLGQINLDTVTGSMPVSHINNIGSINIKDFSGNMPISRVDNIGSIDINTFTGNLPISKVTNIGSIDINTFAGNLPISKVTDLGTIAITTFSGNLPISRVTDLGSIDIGTFSGSLALNKINNLASFGIQNFEGVLVTQQLADGILNDLKKFSTDFRPITRVAALPAPTDPAYPVGTVVLLTTTSVLYKNNGTGFVVVSASDTVTGKISDADILSINCSKFVGQIVAGNVSNIRVDNLVGSLSVAQSNLLSIANMTGNIDMSRVANLNTLNLTNLTGNLDMSRVNNLNNLYIANLQGNLDSSRVANIGNITVTSLKGNLDVSRVANIGTISISTFTGNLDGSRIANLGALNIGSMTGNLTATQLGSLTITNLNATNVTLTGQWTSGQIVSLSAAKLTAGTIDVSGTGMSFSGAAGITVMNGGNVYINPGTLYATSGSFKSVGTGWVITPGMFPSIVGDANSHVDCSYMKADSFRTGGYTGLAGQYISIQALDGKTHSFTVRGGIICDYTLV